MPGDEFRGTAWLRNYRCGSGEDGSVIGRLQLAQDDPDRETGPTWEFELRLSLQTAKDLYASLARAILSAEMGQPPSRAPN